jgi:hypothetical protein
VAEDRGVWAMELPEEGRDALLREELGMLLRAPPEAPLRLPLE